MKLDEEAEQTLTCFHFPAEHQKRIRTTNCLERFNEEIERRSRVIRIFPNDASALRIVVSLAIEQNEEWLTGKRYLDMSLLLNIGELELNSSSSSSSASSIGAATFSAKEVSSPSTSTSSVAINR